MESPRYQRILGISAFGHDAAAAAVEHDRIAFAGHAERYSKRKNDGVLHAELLGDALQSLSGPPDAVAYFERPLRKKFRQLRGGQLRSAARIGNLPRGGLRRSFSALAEIPIRYVGHHESHAAGGYFTSGFSDAAAVVVDGIGEWSTVSVWRCNGSDLVRVAAARYPHSLGLLYSAFTRRVGLKPNEEEYIMMGMAALGQPIYRRLIERELLAPPGEGGVPVRLRRNLHRGLGAWHLELEDTENIAASVQAVLEAQLDGLFAWVAERVPSRNLVYSGGVALNCVYNAHLARSGLFDNIWIMPNPGDAGSSLGAALALRGASVRWEGPFLGRAIASKVDTNGAVERLARGEVIGVATGRAEFGPRALGNRSLLADPRSIEMKRRVNRLKKREPFRPFAPAVLADHADALFDLPVAVSPYMQFTARCKRPDLLPAVCHMDNTSRVQTVTATENPALHDILQQFHRATGCPVLLNTSLNIKGKPLVNDERDAAEFERRYGVVVF